jgi:hypothetical protein
MENRKSFRHRAETSDINAQRAAMLVTGNEEPTALLATMTVKRDMKLYKGHEFAKLFFSRKDEFQQNRKCQKRKAKQRKEKKSKKNRTIYSNSKPCLSIKESFKSSKTLLPSFAAMFLAFGIFCMRK